MTATPQASNSDHTSQRGKIAAVGMFDGVHTGHRHLLSQLVAAAKKHNLTPAVITFANHPLEIIAPARAPQLIMDTAEKQRIIAAATGGPVITLDFDQRLRQTSAREFLEMLHNDHGVTTLLLGFNNRFGHDAPHDFEAYRRLGELTGIEIVKADEMPGASSSAIRGLLAAGNVADAAKLLGRPYTISGNVVEGERIGRTIGFPTANIACSSRRRLIPANGVYACRASVSPGSPHASGAPVRPQYAAMVNIGRRPTVGTGLHETIEAHIIDIEPAEANLYGRQLTLSFVARLRDEMKFNSLADLKAQLSADRQATLRLLDSN